MAIRPQHLPLLQIDCRDTAEIAVMGSKGAAEIIYRQELGEPDRIKARVKEYESRFANPFVSTFAIDYNNMTELRLSDNTI